ncbi:hypothetical protein AA650_05565 [Anabaena sp. WA102]|nr:hypothetical protein AA650_05565 [Anabaena sp. WA102]OBQ17567.1 MAG: hypothetical protein AN486_14660 [Anabaena sp. AL93]
MPIPQNWVIYFLVFPKRLPIKKISQNFLWWGLKSPLIIQSSKALPVAGRGLPEGFHIWLNYEPFSVYLYVMGQN